MQNYDAYTVEFEARETDSERAEREQRLRAAEISRRFTEIDRERIRPLAAIVADTATAEDRSKLAALEQEAAKLRVELAEIGGADGQ